MYSIGMLVRVISRVRVLELSEITDMGKYKGHLETYSFSESMLKYCDKIMKIEKVSRAKLYPVHMLMMFFYNEYELKEVIENGEYYIWHSWMFIPSIQDMLLTLEI